MRRDAPEASKPHSVAGPGRRTERRDRPGVRAHLPRASLRGLTTLVALFVASGHAAHHDRHATVRREAAAGCGAGASSEAGATSDARCVARLVPKNLFEPLSAAMSPGGRFIVYPDREGRSLQLQLYDRASGRVERLTGGPGKRYDPVWSPDGTRVAVWGDIPDAFGKVTQGIGVVDVRTGEERLVFRASGGIATSPAWTPDGRIVFERSRITVGPASGGASASAGGAPNREMWVVDPSGLGARPYLPAGRGRLAYAPDGRRTAWTGGGECRPGDDAKRGLYVGDARGENGRCVLALRRGFTLFAWAPDSETLYYAGPTAEDTAPRLYALPVAEGGEIRRIPSPAGQITGLSVTRSGEVALSIFRPDVGIATVPAGGGVPEPVPLPDSVHGFWPVWHPDGSQIGFTASSWRRGQLWRDAEFVLVDPGRRRPSRPLRRPGAGEGTRAVTGAWSPGGQLFASYRQGPSGSGNYLGPADRLDRPFARLGPADWSFVPGPPAWSPDGERIVLAPGGQLYERTTSGYLPRYGLVSVEVDSALLAGAREWEQTRSALELEGFSGVAQQPRFAPDGGKIAFARRLEVGGSAGVYVAPAGGGPVEAVAEFQGGEMYSGPEWSPDGRWIYFASPDQEGTYRIRRAGRDGGSVETVTRGASHALHPRLSPDGETLAVTLWDAPTEVWVLPSGTPDVDLPPVDTAPLRPHIEPVATAEVDPDLLDLVVDAETAPRDVGALWPGFWEGGQTYAVRTEGEPVEALIVNPGPTPAGYRPVAAERLPGGLRGRLYHARGRPARVDWLTLDIPVVSFPRDSLRSRSDLGNRLFELYRAEFLRSDAGHLADREPEELRLACRSLACPTRDGRSCAALVRMEHQILSKSLRMLREFGGFEEEELRRRMRAYAAVHWLRTLRDPRERVVERRAGVSAYVARRAAMVALGRDPAVYEPRLAVLLGVTAPAGRQQPKMRKMRERSSVSGYAVASLLDRLDPGWRSDVRDGATLLDVLFRLTDLTESRALHVATEAMDEYGFWGMLDRGIHRAPPPSRDTRLNESFYTRAFCHMSPPVRPVRVVMWTEEMLRSPRLTLRWDAGPAGAAKPRQGHVFLADPARFELQLHDLRVVVRRRPVAIVHSPGGHEGLVYVTIYPSREIAAAFEDQEGEGEGASQHVQAGGLDVEIGPRTRVTTYGNGIHLSPEP